MRRRTVYKESPSSKAAFKDKYGVEPKSPGNVQVPAFSQMTISAILKRRSRKGRISFRKGTQLKGASRRHLGSFVKTERVKALKRDKKASALGKEKAPKGSQPQSSRPSGEKSDAADVKPKKKKIFRLFSSTRRRLQKVPENEPMPSKSVILSRVARKRDDVKKSEKTDTVKKSEKTDTVGNVHKRGSQEGTQGAIAGNDKEKLPAKESEIAGAGADITGVDNVATSPIDNEKPTVAENEEKPGEAESINPDPSPAEDASPPLDIGKPDQRGESLEKQPDDQQELQAAPAEEVPTECLEGLPAGSSDSGDKENTKDDVEAGASEENLASDDSGDGVEKTDPGKLNLERWESPENGETIRPTMQLQHQESASAQDTIKPKMKLKHDEEVEEELQLEERTMNLKDLDTPDSFKGEKPNLDHLDPIDPLVQAFNKKKSLSRKRSGKKMNVMGQWVNMNGKWLRIAMVMEERGQL